MSYKLDPTSDDNESEYSKPIIKKSLKNSFLSNLKHNKNKLISKISSSQSSNTSFEEPKHRKSFENEQGDDEDNTSSIYYPLSVNSYVNNESKNQILKKKDLKNRPTVNAFLKNSSFSSSTSTSPPSPFLIHRQKPRKISTKTSLPEQKEVEYPVISNLDDESDENNDDNTLSYYSARENQNNSQKNSNCKSRNTDSSKSRLAKGVCSGSKNIPLNSEYGEEDFIDAFRLFDVNGDGKITAKELKNVLKELGIKMGKQDVKKMIKELDKDGNGTIEYSEFVQMMTSPASRQDDEFELREAFKCIDLDGNGFISREELKDAVEKIMSTDGRISGQDVEEMMKEADTDGNGLIDYDEFVRILVEKR